MKANECFLGLRQWFGFIFSSHSPNDGAARNLHKQIFSGMAIHAFAHPGLAFLGNEPRLIILSDQIVEVMVGLQNHVSTAATVASAGSAFGAIFLSLEGHATL